MLRTTAERTARPRRLDRSVLPVVARGARRRHHLAVQPGRPEQRGDRIEKGAFIMRKLILVSATLAGLGGAVPASTHALAQNGVRVDIEQLRQRDPEAARRFEEAERGGQCTFGDSCPGGSTPPTTSPAPGKASPTSPPKSPSNSRGQRDGPQLPRWARDALNGPESQNARRANQDTATGVVRGHRKVSGGSHGAPPKAISGRGYATGYVRGHMASHHMASHAGHHRTARR
jgi:hypothetical protein